MEIRHIDERLRELAHVMPPDKLKKLRMAWVMMRTPAEKARIEQYIDMMRMKHVRPSVERRIVLPPPRNLPADGIRAGDVQYLGRAIRPFFLPTQDINRHIGVFGATGSGKTTCALQLIHDLHKNGIPFLVLDWEASYRCLLDVIPETVVYTVGRDIRPLHLNILHVPPGISRDEYLKSVINLFAADYLSGAGSDTQLLIYMREAFQKYRNPTFAELAAYILDAIEGERTKGKGKLGGRSGLWKDTVMRIITFLGCGASGEVVNSDYHCPIDTLLSRPTVVEMGGVKSERDRKLIVHLLLNWMQLWLEHRGIIGDELRHLVVLEEFHNITMRGKEDNLISLLFRQARKYGVGLVGLTQSPSEVPVAVMGNMNTKLCFSLSHGADIGAVGKAMNLSYEQAQYLTMQETGEAITSSQHAAGEPFLVSIDHRIRAAGVSDDALRAGSDTSVDSGHICENQGESRNIQGTQNTDTSPLSAGALGPLERCVVSDIIQHPYDGIEVRRKRLELHAADIKQLTDGLIQRGIVQPVLVDSLKLFAFTDSGRNSVEESGLSIPKSHGRGGMEHAYVVHRVVQHLKTLGMFPRRESGGIDVSAADAGVVVEVETGKSDIYTNIRKLLDSRHPHKYMVVTRKDAEITIRRIADTYQLIRVFHFKDFLKLTKSQLLQSAHSPKSTSTASG